MRKSLLVLMVLTLATFGFAKTRNLGNYSFINTDGGINIAVNAVVAAKNLDREYLPFIAYMGTDSGVQATIARKDVVLVYKGKEYHMPTLKELRQNYHKDILDMTMFARETEHIFPSDMSVYTYQRRVDFFPSRNSGVVASEQMSISYTIGARTKLYFKNPGIKKGDTAVLKVRDVNNPNISGSITIQF